MSEQFSKESIKEKHRLKIKEIMKDGGDVEDIVNYIMSRISTVRCSSLFLVHKIPCS